MSLMIYPIDQDEEKLATKLQTAYNGIANCTQKWNMKLNQRKSIWINFIMKEIVEPFPLDINDTVIPHEINSNHIGKIFDAKLR